MFTFNLSQPDLPLLAQPLAKALHPGDILALWGDLGAGKTAFARVLIQCLTDKSREVPSPTFSLVQIYDYPGGEIWHCDLYRLKAPEEILELGIEDAFHQALCLIEWPQRLERFLPEKRIDISFDILSETLRSIKVSWGNTERNSCLATALQTLTIASA